MKKFLKIFLLTLGLFTISATAFAQISLNGQGLGYKDGPGYCIIGSGGNSCWFAINNYTDLMIASDPTVGVSLNNSYPNLFTPEGTNFGGNFNLFFTQSPAVFVVGDPNYLNNSYQALTVKAGCADDLRWNGTSCAEIPVVASFSIKSGTDKSGSNYTTNCTIPRFGSSCGPVVIQYSATSSGSRDSFEIRDGLGLTTSIIGSGTYTHSLKYGYNNFNMYASYASGTIIYTNEIIGNITIDAKCAAGDAWSANSNMCVVDTIINGTTDDVIVDVTNTTLPVVTTTGVTSIVQTTAVTGGNVTTDGNKTVTARGIVFIEDSTGTIDPTLENATNIPDASGGTGSFTSNLSGLTPGASYSVRAYATNSIGTAYGDTTMRFTTKNTPPDLTVSKITPDPQEIKYNTNKTFTAVVTNGGNTTTGSYFNNIFQAGTSKTDVSKISTYQLSTPIQALGAGLSSGVSYTYAFPTVGTYYVRFCTDNTDLVVESNEDNNCADWTTINTRKGSDLTASDTIPNPDTAMVGVSKTFSSDITNIGDYATGNFNNVFQVGANINSPSTYQTSLMSSLSSHEISIANYSYTFNVAGTYYVRFCADNTTGMAGGAESEYNEGNNCAGWTTVNVYSLPSVINQTATNITQTTTTLNAYINNFGNPATATYYFRYGTDHSLLSQTPNKSVSGPNMIENITGLSANTTYYFRGFAINSVGAAYSNEGTFKTLPLPSGTLDIDNGGSNTCEIGIGQSTCPISFSWNVLNPAGPTMVTTPDNDVIATGNPGSVDYDLYYTGPSVGRNFFLYHNVIIGTEPPLDTKTMYAVCTPGTIWTGICAQIPIVATNTIANISYYSATGGGNVTSAGSTAVTSRGIVWAQYPKIPTLTPTLGKYDGNTLSGSGLGSFTSNMVLDPSITYNVRAYATNSIGTGYGNTVVFTTPTLPSGTLTPSVSSCIIPTGGTSCTVPLSWSTANKLSPTAITAASSEDPMYSGLYHEVTTDSGSYTVTAPYPSKRFFLYSSSYEISSALVNTSCDTANYDYWSTIDVRCWKYFYTLSTSKTGTGAGTVTGVSTPGQDDINCGPDCSLNYSGGTTITLTATPDASSTFTSWTGCDTQNSGGQCLVTMNAAKNVTANFKIKTYTLSVTKSGTGAGTVTGVSTPGQDDINCGPDCSMDYTSGTSVTLTATPDANSRFSGWTTGCASIFNPICTVTITAAKSAKAVFTTISLSVVASPLTHNTTPSTNVSFIYTPTANTGGVECRLLDYTGTKDFDGTGLTSWTTNTSGSANTIVNVSPSSAGAYGYFVQCRSNSNTAVRAISSLITVNAIAVSATANPLVYNVLPGASVNFTYTASTTPTGVGSAECLLLDSAGVNATFTYQTSSPIIHTAPNSIGSYGYYVKCRNKEFTTATVISSKITVNTACTIDKTFNGTSCVGPSVEYFTAEDCQILQGENSCTSNVTWNVLNPISGTEVTTFDHYTVGVGNNPGSATYDMYYTGPSVGRTFYLYNNSAEIGTSVSNATCTLGTGWDINKDTGEYACMPPTGTLTAAGCTIPENGSTCPSILTWNTVNPLSGKNSIIKVSSETGTTIATGNSNSPLVSGSSTRNIPYGTTNFYLIHDGVVLDSKSATAGCGSNHHPSGGICIVDVPSDTNTTFTASPTTIFKGKTSTLTWNSSVATSCTVKNITKVPNEVVKTGGATGTVLVSPIVTTSYALSCSNSTGSFNKNQPVKVVDVVIKEN